MKVERTFSPLSNLFFVLLVTLILHVTLSIAENEVENEQIMKNNRFIVKMQESAAPDDFIIKTVRAQQNTREAIIERFQNYLRIDTAQPTPNYEKAVQFLAEQAERIGIEYERVQQLSNSAPILIMRWAEQGTNTSAQSLLLNSHMDVVPVERDQWKYDPFSGYYEKESTGNIYGRGAQDMKCVGMQYLEAIQKLKNEMKLVPPMPIYLTFVPNEEIGGHEGMEYFVKSTYFEQMNIGFALDEGLASEDETFRIFYGERAPFWFIAEAIGQPGHGSSFIRDTSTERISNFISKIFEFRRNQEETMKLFGKKTGDVITINLTSMKAGHTKDGGKTFSMNVIPGVAQIGVDARTPPQVSTQDMQKLVDRWAQECNVTYRVLHSHESNPMTDLSNPMVQSIISTLSEKLGEKTDVQIFPASTDARFLRSKNIPVIGFSPMTRTPVLLHDHNEFLNDEVYLKGIELYVQIIHNLMEQMGSTQHN